MKAAVETKVAALSPSAEELAAQVDLLTRLEGICIGQGLEALAARLADLAQFVGRDMATIEAELATFPRRPQLVGRSASHLLDRGGKRLRPMCVALAAQCGKGIDSRVVDLAVAVELVHSATLLHDDVVDHSDVRRGAPTARSVYGNAASVFAGDWVLIEALRRVERCGLPGLLGELFATIEEMIFAESIQLESRGRVGLERASYFQVVEGKTASVFRWAMSAGALAGGLDEEQREALRNYGLHLGVAFQATDDLLDLTGDAAATGKELFTDLREGKMTYPMILALERDGDLRPVVERIVAADQPVSDADAERVVESLAATRAVDDCLAFARQRSAAAIEALGALPDSAAVHCLTTVAESIVERRV